MKTFRFLKAAAMILGVALCFTLSACGDDDDDDPKPEENTYAKLLYDIQLSDDYYTYFDINVSYTDIEGNTQSQNITSNWKYSKTLATAKAASAIQISVVATAKTTYPEPVEGTEYTLGYNCLTTFVLAAATSGPETYNLYKPGENSPKYQAADIKKMMNDGRVRTVYSAKYPE
jgi:hypothetical protein